jgi:hypothetical protein
MLDLLGSCVVTTFDIAPGVRLAAAWSGGPYVDVHVVDGSGFGTVVEAWHVWDDELDKPRIPKTLDALELLVRRRFEDREAVASILQAVADATDTFGAAEEGFELVPASLN